MKTNYTEQDKKLAIELYILGGLSAVKHTFPSCSKSHLQKLIKEYPQLYNNMLQYWNDPIKPTGLSRGQIRNFLQYIDPNPFTSDLSADERLNLMNICWEWQGGLEDGYGRFRVGEKKLYAHVLSYALFTKQRPKKWRPNQGGILRAVLLHSCDNRICCNPFHLHLGTHEENMMDMGLKGRTRLFGEKSIQQAGADYAALLKQLEEQ